MAMNFTKPATSDNYLSAFVPNIVANQTALSQMLDSVQTTITGTPATYAKRYNRTSFAMEEYSGTVWAAMSLIATGAPWAGVSGRPTTISGYGITDIASYAPSLTGTGASGSWGISITGSAAQLGGVVAANYAVRTAVVSFDDVTTLRASAATTGVVYFGNSAGKYLYWDATNFNLTGPLIVSGNVTAYSDERLKTNWRPLADNFIARLSVVKVGVYDRTDEHTTQVGVSAQSLQELMPEAVITSGISIDGDEDAPRLLSVAYGNAAMAACVMLAKAVVDLQNEIKALKQGA